MKKSVDSNDLSLPNTNTSNILLTYIAPTKGWIPLNFKEIWSYRELVVFFIWRDMKIRYRQTIMGASWAILQPFLTMVVFSVFFGKLAGLPSDGIPYPIFYYSALVPWTFFANGLTNSSTSLITNANMLKKVYFPRITIPLSSVLSGLIDFSLAFLILLAMMIFYRFTPTRNIIFIPLLLSLAIITTLAIGLWFAAMNIKYRDIKIYCSFPYPSLVICDSNCLSE